MQQSVTEWPGWLDTCWISRGERPMKQYWLPANVHSPCVFNSYYPLYPPHEDVGMDISHALQHCRLQIKPDILFLPSELRPFTKVLTLNIIKALSFVFLQVVKQTLCINPGRITKGEVGGTYTKLHIPAGPVNNLHARVGVQILRI